MLMFVFGNLNKRSLSPFLYLSRGPVFVHMSATRFALCQYPAQRKASLVKTQKNCCHCQKYAGCPVLSFSAAFKLLPPHLLLLLCLFVVVVLKSTIITLSSIHLAVGLGDSSLLRSLESEGIWNPNPRRRKRILFRPPKSKQPKQDPLSPFSLPQFPILPFLLFCTTTKQFASLMHTHSYIPIYYCYYLFVQRIFKSVSLLLLFAISVSPSRLLSSQKQRPSSFVRL